MQISTASLQRAVQHFSDQHPQPAPGYALAVSVDGQMVWSNVSGFANLEIQAPIATDSVFHVASISKQFTAVCIAMLVEDNLLDLQDDVLKYIPELPEYGDAIRIHHLLHHTSGLRDDLWLQDFAGWRDDAWVSATDALDLIYRQQGLSAPTGTKFLYTNAGYSLLALIVERVSGMRFEQFAYDFVFAPLGMSGTRFASSTGEIVPNRVTAYGQNPNGGLRTLSPEVGLNGAIGLLTNVDDFARWFGFLDSELSKGSTIWQLMQEKGRLASGEEVDYTLGFFTGHHGQHRVLRHGGSHGGFRSHMVFIPDLALGIVCFANADSPGASSICSAVLDSILPLDNSSIPESRRTGTPLPSTTSIKTGVYFEESWGAYLHIQKRADGMVLVDTPTRNLKPDGDGFLASEGPGMPVRIQSAPDTASGDLHVYAGADPEPDTFICLDVPPKSRQDCEKYTGAYWSAELGCAYHISVAEDEAALILRRRGHEPATIYPVGNHTFTFGFFVNQISLSFSFDRNGGEPEFRLSSLRTRDIRFVRAGFLA